MIAVVDIDGVLADAGHRQHLVSGRPKDWDGFFAAVGSDAVIAEGLALVRELATEHEVVLLSGRPERTRADTQAWLAQHQVPWSRLVLRPDADRRAARLFKAATLRRLSPSDEVAVVIDDDESVIAELTRMGYTSVLFAQGPYR